MKMEVKSVITGANRNISIWYDGIWTTHLRRATPRRRSFWTVMHFAERLR